MTAQYIRLRFAPENMQALVITTFVYVLSRDQDKDTCETRIAPVTNYRKNLLAGLLTKPRWLDQTIYQG
jgi:hypothetical protein